MEETIETSTPSDGGEAKGEKEVKEKAEELEKKGD